ncbi:glycerate kinase [Halyomorpha halys]|uniref:glycerate kinase n=1 Tax=Halyomorpha halys TaxID=286706 RepID=UPI0006D4D3BC|nr:glycerate kinase [Halyomorpha halys]
MVNEEAKRFLRLVFQHIVDSVKPRKLLQLQLKLEDNNLRIGPNSYTLAKNCYVIGFGKAVFEMACEVDSILGSHIQKGILSIPEGSLDPQKCSQLNNKVFKIFQGAKDNIPDENSYKAAKDILELANHLTVNDIMLVLISGGGSALLTYPAPPVMLEEKITVTKLLSRAGATINEMNTVRKQLSLIKGGRLAEAAYPCQLISLILSDVIGDDLATISSGPTVLNEDKSGSGLKILEKYYLLNQVSDNVYTVLNNFKNEYKTEIFQNSNVYIIGNNIKALTSGTEFLKSKNKCSLILTSQLQGLVVNVADTLSSLTKNVCLLWQNKIDRNQFAQEIKDLNGLIISNETVESLISALSSNDEILLLLGGETTVNVTGKGKGGRNMELSLRYSEKIQNLQEKYGLEDFEITFLSGGTDGIDGPTDSAGAISYQGQSNIAKDQGFNISKILADNDSYNFFKKFNNGEDLITIGHTGTNVMDILILNIRMKKETKN